MKKLEKGLTILHIRLYNIKVLKICMRKIVFCILLAATLLYLMQFISCVTNCSSTSVQKITFAQIKSLFFFLCAFSMFGYLTIHWVKVWKKADYMISRAIHFPSDYKEDEEKD